MTAIATGNVTYTFNKQSKAADAERWNTISIAFGNATLTYPTGGIPLVSASMGVPNYIRNVDFQDMSNGDGYIYKWDSVNNKIRIYLGGATTGVALAEMATSSAPAATTLVADVIGW